MYQTFTRSVFLLTEQRMRSSAPSRLRAWQRRVSLVNDRLVTTKSTASSTAASSSPTPKLSEKIPSFREMKSRQEALQDKAERTAKLHEELEGLLNNQVKRHGDRKGFFTGWGEFFSDNKAKFYNVGISFALVLLAYQVAKLRKLEELALEKLEKAEAKASEKQSLLYLLTTRETSEAISQSVIEVVEEQKQQSSHGGWRRRPTITDTTAKDTIAAAVQKELMNRVGDAGMTEEQKKEDILAKLREQQEQPVASSTTSKKTASTDDANGKKQAFSMF